MPFLVPIARGLHGAAAREARESLAAIVAAGFAVVLALALGWSAISRDLADRRLGFYLSRPISGSALWAGKLGAAWLLALAGGAVVWLPSWIASGGATILIDLPRWWIGALVAGTATLVVLAHAAAIALRSRSALLIVDLRILILAAARRSGSRDFLLRRSALGATAARELAAGARSRAGDARRRARRDHAGPRRHPIGPSRAVSVDLGRPGRRPRRVRRSHGVGTVRPTERSLSRGRRAGAERNVGRRERGGASRSRRISARHEVGQVPLGGMRAAGEKLVEREWWTGPSFSADGEDRGLVRAGRHRAPYELVTAALASGRARSRSRTGFATAIPSRRSRPYRPTAGG